MADTSGRTHGPGARRIVATVVVCAAILAAAAGLVVWIRSTEPKAQRTGAMRKSAALVETMVVSNGTYRPIMHALGAVEPVRDIRLRPRVSGRVVEIAPAFKPGGFVREGEILITIDAEDFTNTLAMRESALHQAEAQLAVEEGRRTVAEKEFALLEEEIDAESRALVLREPQIAAARAQVGAAQAAVAQARLDLERTRVKAPFDAQILSREANVGSQVSPGTELARLVGTDRYWVSTTIALGDLERIRLPEGDTPGAVARIRHRSAWPAGTYREGVVESLVGTLDRATRLARVLVTVEDPLARKAEVPPLILGTIVEAQIEGREIKEVIRLARDYVRAGPSVWVYDAEQLAIRKVNVVYEDAAYAYISAGLEDGDEIVKTSLATVAPGIGLKRIDADGSTIDGETP